LAAHELAGQACKNELAKHLNNTLGRCHRPNFGWAGTGAHPISSAATRVGLAQKWFEKKKKKKFYLPPEL